METVTHPKKIITEEEALKVLQDKLKTIDTHSSELEKMLMLVRNSNNAIQVSKAYEKLCEFNDWLLRAMRIAGPVAKPE